MKYFSHWRMRTSAPPCCECSSRVTIEGFGRPFIAGEVRYTLGRPDNIESVRSVMYIARESRTLSSASALFAGGGSNGIVGTELLLRSVMPSSPHAMANRAHALTTAYASAIRPELVRNEPKTTLAHKKWVNRSAFCSEIFSCRKVSRTK